MPKDMAITSIISSRYESIEIEKISSKMAPSHGTSPIIRNGKIKFLNLFCFSSILIFKFRDFVFRMSTILDQRKLGKTSIVGFMIESNLKSGSRKIPDALNNLVYGRSITDGCDGWEETKEMLLYAYEMMD